MNDERWSNKKAYKHKLFADELPQYRSVPRVKRELFESRTFQPIYETRCGIKMYALWYAASGTRRADEAGRREPEV